MKNRYLFVTIVLLVLQLSVAWGQTGTEDIPTTPVLPGADSVRVDSAVSENGLLPVSECEKRAQFVKDMVARKQIKKRITGDKVLKKRVNVLEVKCDSLDNKVAGISDRLKESQTAPISDSIRQPYIIQVCVLTNPLKEPGLKGRQLFMDRVNGYYRYAIGYENLQAAQHDLALVREVFPDAFIRKVK